MSRRLFKLMSVVCAVILSVGCASTKVKQEIDSTFWESKSQPIGVAIAVLPEPDHHATGNQGLLDIAINRGNASDLIEHLKTINLEDYKKVVPEITKAMNDQGFSAVAIEAVIEEQSLPEFEEPDNTEEKTYSSHDFSSIGKTHNVERMLLVRMGSVGTQRSYYGFIPTGDPIAITHATCELIDLNTNELLWRKPYNQNVAVEGEWDQPPTYQNITRAIEKAMLMSRKSLSNTYASKAVVVAK